MFIERPGKSSAVKSKNQRTMFIPTCPIYGGRAAGQKVDLFSLKYLERTC